MNRGYSDSPKRGADIMVELIIILYIIFLTVMIIKKK